MSDEPKVRVWPAVAYDALARSAATYGGIGADHMRVNGVPYCVIGHAMAIASWSRARALYDALRASGIGVIRNDDAVRRINRRRRWYRRLLPVSSAPGTRVTFAEWCAEFGIVRATLEHPDGTCSRVDRSRSLPQTAVTNATV